MVPAMRKAPPTMSHQNRGPFTLSFAIPNRVARQDSTMTTFTLRHPCYQNSLIVEFRRKGAAADPGRRWMRCVGHADGTTMGTRGDAEWKR